MTNKENNTMQNNNFTADSGGENNRTAAFGTDDKSAAESVKNSAKDILDKAKNSAGHAYGLAAEKATAKIEEQKINLSSGLSGIADSLRQVGQTLRESDEPNAVTDLTAKYGESIADRIEKVSGYFENQDLPAIVHDVEVFARRQPAIFIGAAFALGLLTARFLKSSRAADSSRAPRKLTGAAKSVDGQNHDNQDKQTGQKAVNAF